MKITLNPHISVDCVVFGFDFENLKVLLIEREYISDNGNVKVYSDLKLPGSLVFNNEKLDMAASRVLKELTGLEDIYLEQLHVFDSPDRTTNPIDHGWLESTTNLKIERVVSVAYFALVNFAKTSRYISNLKSRAKWYSIGKVGKLAFDHNEIADKALERLQNKFNTEPIAFELLPKKFTIRQLQHLHEIIFNKKLDSRNFRKKISKLNFLLPLNEKQKQVAHKPAQLYKFDKKAFLKEKKLSITNSTLTLI